MFKGNEISNSINDAYRLCVQRYNKSCEHTIVHKKKNKKYQNYLAGVY